MRSIDELTHADDFARFRDPLCAKVGYHLGDVFGLAPCEFKWFDSVKDLVDHVLTVELTFFGYDQEDHDEYLRRLEQVLGTASTTGLTEDVRDSLNQVDWGCMVHWWGTLQDLLSGHTQFSREILGCFAAKIGGDSGVKGGDLRDFSKFLRCCCKSDAASDAAGPLSRRAV